MALPPLTDSAAVLAAVAEYDEIGRQAFLDKYGFGPALRYYMELDNKYYDSKAIVGAAYYHQSGEFRGNQGYSGGLGVQRLLKGLGFTVEFRDPIELEGQYDEIKVEIIQPEHADVTEYEVMPAVGTQVAQRGESALVKRLESYLTDLGHDVSRRRITLTNGEVLITDTFDDTDGVLYEAKSRVDRSTIRHGLGQILDYRRFLPDGIGSSLLLPSEPAADLINLLRDHGVGAIWPDEDDWFDAS
jgi:hypothetical protein